MGTNGQALADQFERELGELVNVVESCPDAQWQATCGAEGWTVAATAHHVAAQWPLEKRYIAAAAEGAPMPAETWDDINGLNGRRAAEFSACNKADVLKALRQGGPEMAAYVRGLSDDQLARTVPLPLADGAEVTAQQLIEGGVLIGHVTEHIKSIRDAS